VAKLELSEYDPAWPQRFQAEAHELERALGDLVLGLEHVGSTAVPGLAGKPTIDVAVGVREIPLPAEATARLEALGFEDALSDSRPGEHRFRKGSSVPREVIVHVVRRQSREWDALVRFRDALRADPALAAEYEALKRQKLAERGEWYSGRDKAALVERVCSHAQRVERGSASPEKTEAVAAALARELRVGDVVTVSGELGSGKTTFVRGACRALGVTVPVTSPTFTVGHRYPADPDVSHLDLFRFRGFSAAEWGDLEPYFEDAICFVEWPEAAADALPAPRVEVRLSHVDPDHRRITLHSSDTALLDRVSGGADTRV
jgi:tRNA threonylcarbamoyladenosine biosynthesis protein TsaE